MVGQVDVKSQPVYFNVQKNTTFSTMKKPIPFDLEIVNIGKAMNLAPWTFTTPTPGLYSFFYNGKSIFPAVTGFSHVVVFAYLNGNLIGSAHSSTSQSSAPKYESYESFSLQFTVNLQAGDKIWLEIDQQMKDTTVVASLHDDRYHYNQFSGWLQQENLKSPN